MLVYFSSSIFWWLYGGVFVCLVVVFVAAGVAFACVSCSCVGLSLVVILIPLSGPLCIPVSLVYLFSIVVLWCVRAFCALKM